MAAFVLFEAADTVFALPATEVVQVLRMVAVAPVPGAPAFIRGVLNVHGTLVPVVDVRARLSGASRPARPQDQLVLARAGERLLALQVDRVQDVVEVADAGAEAGAWADAAPLAAGAVALPGGAVVVHSLAAWAALAEESVPS
jgi:purine-binding chemotaxis protein CheW